MKIESIDFFYISMPVVTDAGDGSQDALLVRLRAGGIEAWGECEASPLTSIASSIAPMSHGACRPVSSQVLGEDVSSPKDIARLAATIQWNCMDLLQAAHTWSGIEIALWDLLGKKESVPVYKLLGYDKAYPKVPYASQLFGDTPAETYAKAKTVADQGYRASKFGWGKFGLGTPKQDADHLMAARDGLGKDGILLVDAGCVFEDDVERAAKRLPALKAARATWYEEPLDRDALGAYGEANLTLQSGQRRAQAGCYTFLMAKQMMDFAGVSFIQIDAGRIGGITPWLKVAHMAEAFNIAVCPHFLMELHVALCAAIPNGRWVEYIPQLDELTTEGMAIRDGKAIPSNKPGIGIAWDFDAIERMTVEGSHSIHL